MVPAVWICRPPTSAAAARSASQAGGSAASRIAAQVVQAPIRSWPSTRAMPSSSPTPVMSRIGPASVGADVAG